MDGYSASFHGFAKKIILNRDECICRDAETAWDMFLRLLKETPSCGDNGMHLNTADTYVLTFIQSSLPSFIIHWTPASPSSFPRHQRTPHLPHRPIL